MKTLIQILFYCSFSSICVAQTTLRGSISQNVPNTGVPFASVTLLNSVGKTIKATSTNEQGEYVFEKVQAGKYQISAFSVGFSKKTTELFELKNESFQAPNIVLEENTTQLKEVTVATKRPFVEQQIDRTVVNVANSIVGSGSTALEVLTKAPGITVDFQKEQIELRGKEGAIVQIDNKQTYLSGSDLVAMLRGISAENIEKIEIITNPSAKYDAAGNSGIINIRLKKDSSLGTNGQLSLAAGSGVHYRTRAGLQLNHRTKKLNLFANYTINKGDNFWDLTLYREQPDGNLRNIINQNTHLIFGEVGNNIKAGLDYSLTKNATLGVVWTGFWNDHTESGNADFDAKRTLTEPIYLATSTLKTIQQTPQNQLVNLNFQQILKNKGQFNIDLDYGKFSKDYSNNLFTKTLINSTNAATPVAFLSNESQTEVGIKTIKADYAVSLSKVWKFETGLKFGEVATKNDIQLKTGEIPNNLVLDPSLSSHFTYNEQVTAAFINFSGKINKTDIQAGLRVENTHSEANLSEPAQKRVRDYLDWFPSLFISKPLSDKQTLIFSYSHRINRPNYQYLNPAKGFVDLFAYSTGNIEIRPQYTHAVELRYALKSGFSASMAGNFIRDFVTPTNYSTEGNKTIRITQNLGDVQSVILTLNQPIMVSKKWQMQATLLGYYNVYKFEYEGKQWNLQNGYARLNVNNGFTFGKGWTGELNGWVNTPRVETIEKRPWLSNVDIGVQKSVSAKSKLKLSVQNIFFTPLGKGKQVGVTSLQSYTLQMDSRVAMLNFTYAFGNQKVKASRQRRTGAEDESRRAN